MIVGACSSAPTEIVVKRSLTVDVPAIVDTLPAQWKAVDSLQLGVLVRTNTAFKALSDSTFIQGKDSTGKVNVKFYPHRMKFETDIKPPDVSIGFPDTIYQTKTIIQETTWLEKLGWMFLGLIASAAIFFFIKKFI